MSFKKCIFTIVAFFLLLILLVRPAKAECVVCQESCYPVSGTPNYYCIVLFKESEGGVCGQDSCGGSTDIVSDCSDCGGGCFTGETKIATPGGGPLSPEASEGQGKEIKDIKEGDVVKSFDSETGEIRGSTVTGIHKREASGYWVLKTESGKEVKVTGEHPFLAQQGMGEVSNVSEVPKVSKGQKISQLLNSIWEKVKEVLK